MEKTIKKLEEKVFSKSDMIDQIKVITEDFKSDLKQVSEGVLMLTETMNRRFEDVDQKFDRIDRHFISIDQHFDGIDQRFDKLENRMDVVDLELAQIKDVVLDIQQEKAPREDVLALAKRVTKLEMNSVKPTSK